MAPGRPAKWAHFDSELAPAQIPLAFLAPDIVRSILAGSQPISLTLDKMIEIASLADWAKTTGRADPKLVHRP